MTVTSPADEPSPGAFDLDLTGPMDDLFNVNPVEFFRGIPLFEGLDDVELHKLLRQMETVYFQAGHRLFSEGDPPDGMYLIERGEVSVTVRTDSSRTLLLAHLGNGSIIGEMALISGRSRSATVSVLSQAQGYYLSLEKFGALRKKGVRLAFKIILQLAKTLNNRRKQLEEQIREMRTNPEINAHLLNKETKELIARFKKG